jgi:hypothetical protein
MAAMKNVQHYGAKYATSCDLVCGCTLRGSRLQLKTSGHAQSQDIANKIADSSIPNAYFRAYDHLTTEEGVGHRQSHEHTTISQLRRGGA